MSDSPEPVRIGASDWHNLGGVSVAKCGSSGGGSGSGAGKGNGKPGSTDDRETGTDGTDGTGGGSDKQAACAGREVGTVSLTSVIGEDDALFMKLDVEVGVVAAFHGLSVELSCSALPSCPDWLCS